MTERHKEQMRNMVGKKVTVRFGVGSKVERILYEDYKGYYIKYKKQMINKHHTYIQGY